MDPLEQLSIRRLDKEAAMPWDLLLDADPSAAAVERYLDASDVYVALISEEVVGTFVLYPVDAARVEIKNIAVLERLQGKGIGQRLLKEAAAIASAGGATTLTIGTANSSVAQLYLYQKCGFEITSIKYKFFLENYPEPLFENGIQCKHMIMLSKELK